MNHKIEKESFLNKIAGRRPIEEQVDIIEVEKRWWKALLQRRRASVNGYVRGIYRIIALHLLMHSNILFQTYGS